MTIGFLCYATQSHHLSAALIMFYRLDFHIMEQGCQISPEIDQEIPVYSFLRIAFVHFSSVN